MTIKLIKTSSQTMLGEFEILESIYEKLRGLIGTTAQHRGVVLARCSSIHTCWMAYPLDVAFIDSRGVVIKSCRKLQPWHADPSRPLSYAISPLLTRYTCTMKYKPWPSSFVCAGVAFSPQAYVEHKKSLVVDRFRAGVLV